MSGTDIVQRFIFENSDIRGEVVCLEKVFETVQSRHDYPEDVAQLLGQALAAAALLSTTIKTKGTLTLQLKGESYLKLLVAQCNEQHHLRGLANWDEKLTHHDFREMVGEGKLAIIIESDDKKQRYQGLVSLDGDNLAICLESYFSQSEQLPTKLWLFSDNHCVSGLMLQTLPSANSSEREFWQHISTISETVTAKELLYLPVEEILHRLFHEEDIRLFSEEPLAFRCTCNIGKMEAAIKMYGYNDAKALLKTQKYIVVNCEFCNNHFEFDKVDIERVFSDSDLPPSNTTH